jgi:ABC-type spermidine/putrescine transport system permease subunit I
MRSRGRLSDGRLLGVDGGRLLLAAPTALLVALFFIAPLCLIALYSFGTTSLVTYTTHFGWTLGNYASLGSSLYLGTILRSLLLSLAATAVCALLGVPIAFFVVGQRPLVRTVLLLAVIVPFWTSFLVRIYAWTNILQNGGPVEWALRHLGLLHGSLDVLYSPWAIAIGIVYGYLPLMVLPVYVALERLDPTVLEAAEDLGSHGWHFMWRVVVPLSRPGLVAGAILVGIPAIGEFVTPQILGGGKTLMLGNVVATQFLDIGDLALGSALAMCLIALVAIVLLVRPLMGRVRRA